MKKYHILAVLAAVVATSSLFFLITEKEKADVAVVNTAVNTVVNTDCTSIDIAAIKAASLDIERGIPQYTATTKNLREESAEEGRQTDYAFNGQRALVDQSFFGETGKTEVRFYMHQDKVVYIKKQNTTYVTPLSQDPSGAVASVVVNEYFLNDTRQVCTWYSNGQVQENGFSSQEAVDFLNPDAE